MTHLLKSAVKFDLNKKNRPSMNYEWIGKTIKKIQSKKIEKKTYPADSRKKAAVDCNKHDWD